MIPNPAPCGTTSHALGDLTLRDRTCADKSMPAPYTVRSVTPEDAPFLRLLYRSTRESELANLPWTEAQKTAFCAMQLCAQTAGYASAYPQAGHWLICAGELPMGRLIKAHTAESVVLVDIALLPTFRGCGLGAALLRDLQREATAISKPLWLSVDKRNPALALYLRLGFSVHGEQDFRLQMVWHQISLAQIMV